MPTVIVSSNNPFVPFSTVQSLYTSVIQNRMAAPRPSRTKAVIICDALRDEYLSEYLQDRIRWVTTNLVSMGFDRYDIVPCMVYWPPNGRLKRTDGTKHRRLSIDLFMDASVVVLMGGNVHGLLQSFNFKEAYLTALKQQVNAEMCLLLTWSAGSTSIGSSVEHSRDRLSHLQLSMNQAPSVEHSRGLGLIPKYSFAPHWSVEEYPVFWARLRGQERLWYGGRDHWVVLLPEGASVVFWESEDPVDWTNYFIGWIDMGGLDTQREGA